MKLKKATLGFIFFCLVLAIFTIIFPANSKAVNLINTEDMDYIISYTDSYIDRILPKTEESKFKEKFVEGENLRIYKSGATEGDEHKYIQTGMTLVNQENIGYYLIVIGDLNGDGDITQIDITNLIKYLVDSVNFPLSENLLRAGDLNYDNLVNQVDLTLMIRYIFTGELEVETFQVPLIFKVNDENGEKYINDTWINENIFVGVNPKYKRNNIVVSYEVQGANTVEAGTTENSVLKKDGISKVIATEKHTNGTFKTSEYIVKIDQTAPKAPEIKVLEGTKKNNGVWYSDKVEIQINASEAEENTSKVENVVYKISGDISTEEKTVPSGETLEFNKDGRYTITAYTYDEAGNKSQINTFDLNIDGTKPYDSKIEIVEGTIGLNNWYTSDLQVKFISGRDETSQIGKLTYSIAGDVTKAGTIAEQEVEIGEFTSDDIEIKNGDKTIIAAEGQFRITFKIYDNAGNYEEVIKTVKIDKETDTRYTYKIVGTEVNNGYYTGNIQISLVWNEDLTSGLEKVTYSILGAEDTSEKELEYDQKMYIQKEGVTDIVIRAYDKAGNVYTDLKELRKDSAPPKNIDIAYKDAIGTEYTLVINAEDEISGMAEYRVYINNELYETIKSTEESVECKIINETLKPNEAYVICVDQAGLEATSETITIQPVRLIRENIKYAEFIIDEFVLLDRENNTIEEGVEFFVSDTSLTTEGKYIQVSAKANNITGVIKGHTRIVTNAGLIVEDMNYYPENFEVKISHYSSGSGRTWRHITTADLYGTALFNNGEEEITRENIVGIIDKINNVFNITEEKEEGVETYTRMIINSINCDEGEIPFRIVTNVD